MQRLNWLLVTAAAVILLSAAPAEDGLVSTMNLMAAVGEIDGIRLVPAADIVPPVYTEDYGPSQVLEIIRPNGQPVTIGRLHSSCTCVSVRAAKRTFGPGERALLEVRNVKATPAAGATYAVFVQLTSPVREALQYDVFVKSTGAPAPAAAGGPPRPTAKPAAPGVPEAVLPAAPPPSPGTRSVTGMTVNGPAPFTYEDV
ncbi:MAG: hypothetical protein LIP77_07585, partial [Planctomycetes bacterium]|nr:hypothetical protein [Planctomycetota bacterium]